MIGDIRSDCAPLGVVLAVQEITGDDAAARSFIEAATDRFTTRTDITNQVGGTAYSIGSFLQRSVVDPLQAQIDAKTAELATANANLQAAYARHATDNATIGTLNTLNHNLTNDLTSARTSNVQLTSDLASARSNNAQLTAQVNSVFVQLDAQVDELDRLEDEVASLTADIASLNQQIVDGMALANTNRIQAEAALAAMTQHKNNWKARALDMEVHKNNWKAKSLAGLAVSTVGTAPAVATQDNYRNASTEAAMYNGVATTTLRFGHGGGLNFNNDTQWGTIASNIADHIALEAENAYDRGYEDGYADGFRDGVNSCLLYTSPSPRD